MPAQPRNAVCIRAAPCRGPDSRSQLQRGTVATHLTLTDPIGAADTMRRCLPARRPIAVRWPRRSARVQAARPRGRAGARGTAPRCLGRARTCKHRSRRPRRAAHRLLMRREPQRGPADRFRLTASKTRPPSRPAGREDGSRVNGWFWAEPARPGRNSFLGSILQRLGPLWRPKNASVVDWSRRRARLPRDGVAERVSPAVKGAASSG